MLKHYDGKLHTALEDVYPFTNPGALQLKSVPSMRLTGIRINTTNHIIIRKLLERC